MISGRVIGLSGGLLLHATLALAQPAANVYTPIQPIPLGDVLLNLPTSHISGLHTWEVRFTHRFNQPINEGSFSDGVHSFFGLDSNADVGIGLSYVLKPRLQLSFYRSNAMDDIELAAKYILIQQAPAVPLSAAIRIGGDWRTERTIDQRTTAFVQGVASRQFGRRVEVFLLPTVATKAGRQVVGASSIALFRWAFNVPMGLAVTVGNGLSVIAEFTPKNHDVPLFIRSDLAWALGLKRAVGGHHFEVMLTNSSATHVDQYITSTYMGSPLHRGDLHIGFNIERRFGGGAY